jgi:hypothetical protein
MILNIAYKWDQTDEKWQIGSLNCGRSRFQNATGKNVVITFSGTMTLYMHSCNDQSHLAPNYERHSRPSAPTRLVGHCMKWFCARINILIYNSWFRMKVSNHEYELSVGEARRFSHSASYLLSPNSSNHCSIAMDCLKLSKSMSSRRLRHLTCLQTICTFWRGIRSLCSEILAPDQAS